MTVPFDPALWLSKIEGLGFRFSVRPRADGSLKLGWCEPDTALKGDLDIALFRELRPDAATSQRNRRTLAEHLRNIGRIGWPKDVS